MLSKNDVYDIIRYLYSKGIILTVKDESREVNTSELFGLVNEIFIAKPKGESQCQANPDLK